MPVYSFSHHIPDIDPSVFIAPGARIIGDVSIKAKSSVWFQTVIRGDMDRIRIGRETNIQDLCTCHADKDIPLTVGDRVTIGHGCIVHGCTIENESLIGMGAVIMNNAVVGKGSVIAAGSVVLEKTVVPPYSLVTGSPGKIKKRFKDQTQILKWLQTISGIYTSNAETYRSAEKFHEIDRPE